MSTTNMFSWRSKKNINSFWLKEKVPYLELSKLNQDNFNVIKNEPHHERDVFGEVRLFFFFFDLGFTALSRIFHLYRADRSSKVGENRSTRRKTT